jgi:hypothetical protein
MFLERYTGDEYERVGELAYQAEAKGVVWDFLYGRRGKV